MKRIILMVLNNLWHCPYWFLQLSLYGRKNDKHTEKERFALIKKITVNANRGGRVKIMATGLDNIPQKDGFIMYPNHQGLYDTLAFIESIDHPFSVIIKKEVKDIFFLKQVFAVLRAKAIDREDVKQAMKVILEVSKEVESGRNYIIYAEGTRSRQGNQVQDFKGGSFKAAIKAKCPIVPVAILNAFKPFDTNTIDPVEVEVHYLPPLYYQDYKEMKSIEIAQYVKEEIQKKINSREQDIVEK